MFKMGSYYADCHSCQPLFSSTSTDDARLARTAQGGMVVPDALQDNMKILRESRPGLAEKYAKFPFEE